MGEGAGRTLRVEPSARRLMINSSDRHRRHRAAARVQVSTDVGGSVLGSFTRVINLTFTVTTKLLLLTSLGT